MFKMKNTVLMGVMGGVALAAMTGCDSDELTYEIQRPAGLTIQRPLAQENKPAYIAMMKDKSNARFPNMDRNAFYKYILKDIKITHYEELVKRLGPPDEVIFSGLRATRSVIYYNMVFHDKLVASVGFSTGDRLDEGVQREEKYGYQADIKKAYIRDDDKEYLPEFFIPKNP